MGGRGREREEIYVTALLMEDIKVGVEEEDDDEEGGDDVSLMLMELSS